MSYDPQSPDHYPAPFPNETVGLPIETEGRVLVHTELGVEIYFTPATAMFSAQMTGVQGRGSASELHAPDFPSVVARIRERALVVPVEAYLLSIDELAEDDAELVRAHPCTILEHHPRRGCPFVVRVVERTQRSRFATDERATFPVRRVRTVERAYLPDPESLARLVAATRAIRDEHRRHRAELERLQGAQRVALDAVGRVGPDDLVAIQAGGDQRARAPGELGAVVYEEEEEEELVEART